MELLRRSGETAAHVGLEPDWDPAIEWARLAGLRTRGVWAPESDAERAIEPLWHEELGEPFMRGFRVHLESRDGTAWHEDFSTRYFRGLAGAAAARLIEKGALDANETILFRALAYEQRANGADTTPPSFTAVDQPPPLPLRDVPRARLMQSSAPGGDTEAGDFEVFMPRAVLDEASALTEQAGDAETGGVLIGHLDRERGDAEIFLEVTALVPARHTVGTSTKLTFTSDTWTDVRRAVELRAGGELVIGWFHSHPQLAWCREKGCSVEQQRECPAADGFLSSDDQALHRTVFPRAFTVALVMTRSVRGIFPRLFGWRSGALEPRGFRVLEEATPSGEPVHADPATA